MKQVTVEVPGKAPQSFGFLVLDFNGTLALDGKLIDGVKERLRTLGEKLQVVILTADTHGTAKESLSGIGVTLNIIATGEDKKNFVLSHSEEGVITIGNGYNDLEMTHVSDLGIAVLGPEGMASELCTVAKIVTRDICDALDLILFPKRLVATLRN